ncbi:unnamed protein product [Staurois parvus]|uniref:Uncharacterized protein n=1 Tax=Staurois parvus TaxID=386267 RepID=A0ABN9HW74_9NEOB|nr:unnamed protein product [Staurois parvus]
MLSSRQLPGGGRRLADTQQQAASREAASRDPQQWTSALTAASFSRGPAISRQGPSQQPASPGA